MIREMVEDVLKGKKALTLAIQLKFHLLKVYNVGMGCIYTPKEILNIMTQIVLNAKIIIRNNQDKLQRFKPTRTLDQPIDLIRSKIKLNYRPEYDMYRFSNNYIIIYKKSNIFDYIFYTISKKFKLKI